MTENTPPNQEFSEDDLFRFTMEKQWDKVVEIYEKHPASHKTMLTECDETALHISVLSYHSKHLNHSKQIKKMIDCIEKSSSLYEVLLMQDVKGETLLHLAAAVVWDDICEYIASKYQQLISLRNLLGETPLFIAAHHGKLQAFLCLHENYNKEGEADESPCRRYDGTTILHVAISGEYFRLAYQIISYYPKLINSVNVDGESPLHVLARKPNVFKSSYQIGFYDSLIYHCVFVAKLKEQKYDPRTSQNVYSPSNEINLPENSRTSGFPCNKKQKGDQTDEENQHQRQNKTHGYWRIKKIREKKIQHSHAFQIMSKMIDSKSKYKYDSNGQRPPYKLLELEERTKIPNNRPDEHDANVEIASSTKAQLKNKNAKDENKSGEKTNKILKEDTPLLVAAKTGIPEMVKKILSTWPVAIQDRDSSGKNVLLLAAENRQTNVFDYLVKTNLPEYTFHQLDNEGNSIFHLAARLGEEQPWRIPRYCTADAAGDQVVRGETKQGLFQYVKRSVPPLSFVHHNIKGDTPRKIFTETHTKLVKDGNKWLIKTSESCSVIAALIATGAFATSSTVPVGLNQETGHPILEYHVAFDIFSITSLVALYLSVTALVFLLAIITSRREEREFGTNLPRKLLIGLTSLFASIAAMLLSFCAGHTFILRDRMRVAAVPIYAVATIPVTFFAIVQLPLYFDLLRASYKKVPLRSYRVFYH